MGRADTHRAAPTMPAPSTTAVVLRLLTEAGVALPAWTGITCNASHPI